MKIYRIGNQYFLSDDKRKMELILAGFYDTDKVPFGATYLVDYYNGLLDKELGSYKKIFGKKKLFEKYLNTIVRITPEFLGFLKENKVEDFVKFLNNENK